MSIVSKKRLKKFEFSLLVFVLVFFSISFFSSFIHPEKVKAVGIEDTAFDNFLINFQDPELNKQLRDCEIGTVTGLLTVWKPFEKLFFNDEATAENLYCLKETAENGETEAIRQEAYAEYLRISTKSSGLVGSVSAININVLKQRPASGLDYIGQKAYALANPGKVSAQSYYFPGTGFQLLHPIQSMWGWSVNVVYGLLIFVMIFVAFGVMFRGKLPGGAAVTLQSAIPNIAIAMVLVPLSYAISGLFIDAVTIGTNVAHEFLIGPSSPARIVYEERDNPNFLNNITIPDYVKANDRGLYADDYRINLWNAHNYQNIGGAFSGLLSDEKLSFIPSFVVDIFTAITGDAGDNAWVAGIINAAIGGLLLLTSIRIFVLLFQKFMVFMLYPVFSPFVFATIAIPGNGKNQIMQYLKTMGAASAFYIVTYTMLLLVVILNNESFVNTLPDYGNANYIPPLLGLEGLGLTENTIGSNGVTNSLTRFILSLIGIALYLNIPAYLQSIDAAWGTKLTIPQFLTQARDSAKASINLGKQIARAPGQAYKVPGQIRTSSNRLLQTAANYADRVRGIRPGERGSTAYNRSVRIQNEIKNRERRRAQAVAEGNFAEARRLESNINIAKERLAGISTSTGTGSGKVDDIKEGKLSIEITWGGQGGPIVLKEGTIKDLIKLVENGIMSTKLRGGKLALKAEGFRLSPMLLDKIRVYGVRDPNTDPINMIRRPGSRLFTNSDTDRSSDLDTGQVIVEAGNLENTFIQSNNPATTNPNFFQFLGGAVMNTVRVVFEESPSLHPSSDGTGYEVGFDLLIENIPAFLGLQGNPSLISPIKMISTQKHIFEIVSTSGNTLGLGQQPVQSNPADIKLTSDFAI